MVHPALIPCFPSSCHIFLSFLIVIFKRTSNTEAVIIPVKPDVSDVPMTNTRHRISAFRGEEQSEDSFDLVLLGSLHETQLFTIHLSLNSMWIQEIQPPPDLRHGTKFPV